jgi:hypothetical protein
VGGARQTRERGSHVIYCWRFVIRMRKGSPIILSLLRPCPSSFAYQLVTEHREYLTGYYHIIENIQKKLPDLMHHPHLRTLPLKHSHPKQERRLRRFLVIMPAYRGVPLQQSSSLDHHLCRIPTLKLSKTPANRSPTPGHHLEQTYLWRKYAECFRIGCH